MLRLTRRAAPLLAVTLSALSACGGGAPTPSLTGTRVVPHGYSIYRAAGYSFAYPAGWRLRPYRSDPTQGGVSVVPPGPTPADAAYPRIDLEAATARGHERSRRAIRRSRTAFGAPVLDRRFGSVDEHPLERSAS